LLTDDSSSSSFLRELRDEPSAVPPLVRPFVLLVGLIAAAGAGRRGLRIQPNEALKEG
jgi:hypothetical protein